MMVEAHTNTCNSKSSHPAPKDSTSMPLSSMPNSLTRVLRRTNGLYQWKSLTQLARSMTRTRSTTTHLCFLPTSLKTCPKLRGLATSSESIEQITRCGRTANSLQPTSSSTALGHSSPLKWWKKQRGKLNTGQCLFLVSNCHLKLARWSHSKRWGSGLRPHSRSTKWFRRVLSHSWQTSRQPRKTISTTISTCNARSSRCSSSTSTRLKSELSMNQAKFGMHKFWRTSSNTLERGNTWGLDKPPFRTIGTTTEYLGLRRFQTLWFCQNLVKLLAKCLWTMWQNRFCLIRSFWLKILMVFRASNHL